MVTTNIKDYRDEDIIGLLNGLQNGEIPYTLNDLKVLLSEVTNRKLDSKYINVLTSLMHGEITGVRSAIPHDNSDDNKSMPPKRPVSQKASVQKAKPNNSQDAAVEESDEDYEMFPVLSFLSGLYKVLAWLFLVVGILGGAIAGFVFMKGDVLYTASCLFGGIMAGTLLLIFFYANSEKILLKLEIERHLRRK